MRQRDALLNLVEKMVKEVWQHKLYQQTDALWALLHNIRIARYN
jgi:hypothetical protein